MTGRILTGALIAGLVAGFLAAILNLWTLTPLILQAEGFEGGHSHAEGAAAHSHADATTHSHDDGTAHTHGSEAASEPGQTAALSRAMGTVATTLVAYAGFGLLLGAGMALAARAGHQTDAQTGLLWGLGGFAALHLAPAVGLPPELPGLDSAALASRQMWWAFCVAATATGLACLAFGRLAGVIVLGAALILLPHAIGAPQPATHGGTVPPGLAAAFATRSLGVAALSWAVLGTLAGLLAERQPVGAPA
jgi:cobalt transporter subunit CbtA